MFAVAAALPALSLIFLPPPLLSSYSYLRLDTILLGDVLINYRNACRINFGLDPYHFLGIAHYNFSSLLKHTGVKLDLIHDPDIALFGESSIMGGLSCALEERFFEASPGREAIQLDVTRCSLRAHA